MAVPDWLQQVEYISTDGSHYFNTGVNPRGHNVILEVCCEYNTVSAASGGYGLMGCMDSTRFHMGMASNGTQFHSGVGTSYGFPNVDCFQRHIYKLDSSTAKLYIDGSVAWTGSTGTLPNCYIYLFTRCDSGSPSVYNCSAKLFWAKITVDGTVVRNYTPVFYGSTHQFGLYDSVEGGMITSAVNPGTVGGPFYYICDFLDYIKSDGNQYIYTGVIQNQTCRIDCGFKLESATSVYGGTAGASMNYTSGSANGSGYFYFHGGSAIGNTGEAQSWCHISQIQTSCYRNGRLVGSGTYSEWTDSRPMILFGRLDTSGNRSDYGTCSISYFTIWKDGRMERTFIPAIHKYTNKIGMFDTKEGKFYENKGTGTFQYGRKVNSIDLPNGIRPASYRSFSYCEVNNTYMYGGFTPSLTALFSIRVSVKFSTLDGNECVFCSRGSTTMDRSCSLFRIGNKIRFDWYNSQGNLQKSGTDVTITTGKWYTILVSNILAVTTVAGMYEGYDVRSGTQIGSKSYTNSMGSFTCGSPLYFFRSHLYDGSSYSSFGNYAVNACYGPIEVLNNINTSSDTHTTLIDSLPQGYVGGVRYDTGKEVSSYSERIISSGVNCYNESGRTEDFQWRPYSITYYTNTISKTNISSLKGSDGKTYWKY